MLFFYKGNFFRSTMTNAKKLWLAYTYTELQGEFWCYKLIIVYSRHFTQPDFGHVYQYQLRVWGTSDTLSYWKGSWASIYMLGALFYIKWRRQLLSCLKPKTITEKLQNEEQWKIRTLIYCYIYLYGFSIWDPHGWLIGNQKNVWLQNNMTGGGW